MSAYRAPEPTKPDELVYEASDAERHVGPLRDFSVAVAAGAIAAVAAAAAGQPELAGGFVVASLIAGWTRRRRRRGAPDVAGLVLRVHAGELSIVSRDRGRVITTVRLAELRDVALDTKTIRKVEPGGGTIPALRHLETTVGPEIDTARIVFLPEPPRPAIRLTEAYLAHMDSVEQLGKIRSFLRAHGWIPEDERVATDDDDD